MKRFLALLPVGSFFAALFFLSSCQHSIPVTCDDVNFSLSTTHTNVSNNTANGTITANATGGSGITYSLNGAPAQDTGYFNNLGPGTYYVSASNALGCSETDTVIIGGSVNPCLGVNITVSATATDATLGQSNGSIRATATPAGAYTYSIDGTNFQALGNFVNLPAGTYTITAKNASGCTGTRQVTINSVDPCSGVVITVSTTQSSPTTGQSNGSITATAAPAGTYTYNINGGTFQSSGTFTGLAAGTYTIIAKNANGCTSAPVSVVLGAVDPCAGVTITVTTTPTNPTNGQSNGSIVAVANPAGTYTYSINGGTYQSSGTFSSLAPGTYTITAKNANGCIGSSNPVSLVNVDPCAGVTISFTSTTVNVLPCPSTLGSIAIAATGSTGYTYSSNGGTSYQTASTFTSLAAGTYNIKVKDGNGCTSAAQSVTVGTQAMGPLFTAVRTIIHAKCGNCHLNGGNTAGYNFDSDCSIVSKWSQIKGSCVQPYTLRQMPPSAPLTSAQQTSITNWVTAGHRYTD